MADIKTGFKYYNVDTDRYQDMKIKRLKKKFSCDGIAIYDYVLCEVYRVKGCYTDWDENFIFDVADYFGIEEDLVIEIINFCCIVGLFDFLVLKKLSVLTSKSIQDRYVDMSKRAKRYSFEIPEKILIVPENIEIIPEKVFIVQEKSETKEKTIYEKIDEASNYLTCPEEQQWRDIVCMQNRMSPEGLIEKINEFTGLQKERGEYEVPKEFRKHFTNWLKIENQKINSVIKHKSNITNLTGNEQYTKF